MEFPKDKSIEVPFYVNKVTFGTQGSMGANHQRKHWNLSKRFEISVSWLTPREEREAEDWDQSPVACDLINDAYVMRPSLKTQKGRT